MIAKTFAALSVAALASTALGQSVTVSVEGPATAAPGDVVTVEVYAEVASLAPGAIGGYGLDLDITANASAVSNLTAATTNPTLNLGVLPGTASATGIERAVGGQLANVFSLNPGIDTSSKILLFTTDATVDAAAADGTVVTFAASIANNGGIVIYPDANAGANVNAPGDAGTSVSFVDYDLTVSAPPACPGDVNGDGATDVSDFFILGGNFGTTSGATLADGDLNGDGAVDVSDFFILGGDFGCPNN